MSRQYYQYPQTPYYGGDLVVTSEEDAIRVLQKAARENPGALRKVSPTVLAVGLAVLAPYAKLPFPLPPFWHRDLGLFESGDNAVAEALRVGSPEEAQRKMLKMIDDNDLAEPWAIASAATFILDMQEESWLTEKIREYLLPFLVQAAGPYGAAIDASVGFLAKLQKKQQKAFVDATDTLLRQTFADRAAAKAAEEAATKKKRGPAAVTRADVTTSQNDVRHRGEGDIGTKILAAATGAAIAYSAFLAWRKWKR